MFKEIVRALDYSDCAEAALVLFVIAFGLILLTALGLSSKSSQKFASIPLDDEEVQDPRNV